MASLESEFDPVSAAHRIEKLALDFLHDPSENPDPKTAEFSTELQKVFSNPKQADAVMDRLLKDNWRLDNAPFTHIVRSPWTREITAVEFVAATMDINARRQSAHFPVKAAIEREQRALASIGMSIRFDPSAIKSGPYCPFEKPAC